MQAGGQGFESPQLHSSIQDFIDYRKATKGLTVRGEEWLRDVLAISEKCLPLLLPDTTESHIVALLAQYQDRPWRRHGLYRGLRSFWKWASPRYGIDNPTLGIEAPKLPVRILHAQDQDSVRALIEAARCIRDKAIVALAADSGARRSELVSIQVSDVDLRARRIRVTGKGNREGWLLLGDTTASLLMAYITEAKPKGSLFGLKLEGLKTMFQRLEQRTSIKANPHSFRRGFAVGLRKAGINEMDIAQMGRWSSLRMVQLYSRNFTFDDAAQRYQPMVTP